MDLTGNYTTEELKNVRNVSKFLKSVPKNAEGSLVLVGKHEKLKCVVAAFVRLAEGSIMPSVTEVRSEFKEFKKVLMCRYFEDEQVPIPVRFVFFIMGPSVCELNYIEVGRCMAILLSNSVILACLKN